MLKLFIYTIEYLIRISNPFQQFDDFVSIIVTGQILPTMQNIRYQLLSIMIYINLTTLNHSSYLNMLSQNVLLIQICPHCSRVQETRVDAHFHGKRFSTSGQKLFNPQKQITGELKTQKSFEGIKTNQQYRNLKLSFPISSENPIVPKNPIFIILNRSSAQ